MDIQPFVNLISQDFAPCDEFGRKKMPSESVINNILTSFLEIPSRKLSE